MDNIIKNNNFNQVFSILDSKNINNLNNKLIKRILYKFQKEKEIIKIYENIFNKFKNDEAFLTIGMNIYLSNNDVQSAYKLLKLLKEKKKRNVLPIFKYYCLLEDELLFSFYKNNMYDKYIIDENEYFCLIKQYKNDKEKLEFIFNDMKNNLLKISKDTSNLLQKNNSKIVHIKNNICVNCCNKLLSITFSIICFNSYKKLSLFSKLNTHALPSLSVYDVIKDNIEIISANKYAHNSSEFGFFLPFSSLIISCIVFLILPF